MMMTDEKHWLEEDLQAFDPRLYLHLNERYGRWGVWRYKMNVPILDYHDDRYADFVLHVCNKDGSYREPSLEIMKTLYEGDTARCGTSALAKGSAYTKLIEDEEAERQKKEAEWQDELMGATENVVAELTRR